MFSAQQFCHWADNAGLSSFIPLAVVVSQKCKAAQTSKKISTYSSSKSSKVIDLGVNQKHIMQLPNSHTSSNFGRILYHFQDFDT